MEHYVIGSYTANDQLCGIYTMEGDQGELHIEEIGCPGENPSFLCAWGTYLYAVNERADQGKVSAYQRMEDGTYQYRNSLSVPGADACHLAVEEQGRNLYVANYSSGCLFVCGIGANGDLLSVKQHLKFEGHGVNPIRQEKAHMHCVTFSPDQNYLFAADLGTDRVYSFRRDEEGMLIPNPHGPYWQAADGVGPRHLLFSQNGETAWLITEMGCNITVLDYQKETGTFAEKQTVELIDKINRDQTDAAAAELALSPDGRFLYASVRFYDRVVGYEVADTGCLKGIGEFSSYGKVPRHICMTEDGTRLLIANQDSDQIVVCSRNEKTGRLEEKLQELKVAKPVCILPL